MHTLNEGENTVTDQDLLVLYVASCSSKDPDYEEKKRIAEIQAEWHKRKDKKLIRFAAERVLSITEFGFTLRESFVDELYQEWLKTQSS